MTQPQFRWRIYKRSGWRIELIAPYHDPYPYPCVSFLAALALVYSWGWVSGCATDPHEWLRKHQLKVLS